MSPDGLVYFIRTITTIANLDQAEIYRIPARGGAEEPVVSTLRRAMHPLLMPDRQSLVYAANPSGVDLGRWWRPIAGGDAQQLTMGTGDFSEPRVSADGRTIVATRLELRQSLTRIMVRPEEFGRSMDITDGYGGDLDPSLSPTGNLLAFSSSRTGDRHIWVANADGSDARPLTSGNSLDDRPAFSPDGSRIAFNSDRDGRRGIWVISAEGGTPRKVVEAAATGALSWSRDGQRIVYAAGANSWPGLWAVTVETGQVKRIAAQGAVSEPAWSPTRDVIAYLEPTTSGPSSTRLTFVDPAGARMYEALPPAPAISGGFGNGVLAWSPDGRLLAIATQNSNLPASLWLVDPEATMPFRKLVELPPGPRIRGVTWTRDGAAIIIGQHDATSDIVLLDGGQ
jgi:Tol biopolymer transport system component